MIVIQRTTMLQLLTNEISNTIRMIYSISTTSSPLKERKKNIVGNVKNKLFSMALLFKGLSNVTYSSLNMHLSLCKLKHVKKKEQKRKQLI